jgi:hypothetical protein
MSKNMIRSVFAAHAVALCLIGAAAVAAASELPGDGKAKALRADCIDKVCPGDKEPQHNTATETALKLNGQWFLAPKEYFTSDSAAFYWPQKLPAYAAGDFPAEIKGHDFSEVSVQIFFTGRGRWTKPTVARPWAAQSWEARFADLQRLGLRMERVQMRPDLERIRFFDRVGKQYRHEYWLATNQQRILGDGPPGISCDLYPGPRTGSRPRCTGGMFWQKDVYADFRFHAKHASDWPAIHQEMMRVLGFARRALQ